MMRRRTFAACVGILASLVLPRAARAEATAAPPPDACRLLPEAEVARVQGATFREARATRHDTAELAISQCFYAADPFSKSVSLEVVSAPKADAVLTRWKKMFHERHDVEEDERRGGEAGEKHANEVPVAGLGEEAFWVPSPATGALHVLANGVSFRVSLGGAGTADAKLARCRALAEKLLASLRPPQS